MCENPVLYTNRLCLRPFSEEMPKRRFSFLAIKQPIHFFRGFRLSRLRKHAIFSFSVLFCRIQGIVMRSA